MVILDGSSNTMSPTGNDFKPTNLSSYGGKLRICLFE